MFPDMFPKPAPSSNDWREEFMACKYWDRPPRSDLNKNPFYPWMPPTYNVKFNLNFK